MTPATVIPEYLERIDRAPDTVVAMLAADFTFCILSGDGAESRSWIGGLGEFSAYFARRARPAMGTACWGPHATKAPRSGSGRRGRTAGRAGISCSRCASRTSES